MMKYSKRRVGYLRSGLFSVQPSRIHVVLLATTARYVYPAKFSLLKFPLIDKVCTHNIAMNAYLALQGA